MLAFLVFCISILIIIALLQTLVYQSPTPSSGPEELLETPWVDGGGNNGGQKFDGCCRGIIEWCNGCCLAPSKLKPTDRELKFSVSPASPKLYWTVFTADEYTGLGWRRSTKEKIVNEFPSQAQDDEHIFTVKLNAIAYKLSLPIPPPPSLPELSRLNLAPSRNFTLYLDKLADVYGIEITGPINKTSIDYQATWHHIKIDKSRISLKDAPQEIRTTYLQLPEDLPQQVRQLAYELENSSLNVFDQIFADMRYLMTNFIYDTAFKEGKSSRTIEDDWVLSYLEWGKGICIDAATTLAVILRCQGIPARINFGFKPGETSGNKTLYFSTNAHSETEAYLPPYGWVRFDATPPCRGDGWDGDDGLLEDYPAFRPCIPPPKSEIILEIYPKEMAGEPGDRLIFYVMVNNSGFTENCFSFYACTELGWNITVHPKNLTLEPFGKGQFLVEVTIPSNATFGQECRLNVTVKCSNGEQASVSASIKVVKERIPTVTSITHVPKELVLRQEPFYIEGVVKTLTDEPVHGMQVYIYIKENKEAEGILCGKGFSEENGSFRIECLVPSDFEVGDYCVVARSAGTVIYAASESDPSIKIGARTSIQLNIQKIILLNENATVSGELIDDNETPIPNAPIELKIGGEEISDLLTNENGEFIVTYQFAFNGPFEVNAAFSGTEYFLPSSNSTTINVYVPVIETSMDYLVRGEENEIKGTIMAGDIGVEGKMIAIDLDDRMLAIVETGLNGFFVYNQFVDLGQSLDHGHTLSFTIQETRACLNKQIKIMARTRLDVSVPQEVTQGGSFTFNAYLFDDLGLPIMNENIVADGLSGTTQEDGKVEFSKYVPLWFWFKEINSTCDFEGSDKYLPSKANAIVVTQPNLLLFIFPSAVVVSAVSVYLIRRRRLGRAQTKDKENLSKSKPPSKQEKPPPAPTKSPLKLVFPDILPPFPNVWGVGENLRIKCYLNATVRNKVKGNKRIHFSVNGKKIGEEQLSKGGEALITDNFPKKGKYTVTAELKDESEPSMRTNVSLRIVDYREEIIRLYKTFLQHLNIYNLTVEENTTAREVESLLLSSGDFDREYVHNLVDCFEEAEYSDHHITRSNYETMYLSLKGLNLNA